MCLRRAVSSRSILTVVATLSTALAAPTLAEGFALGMTLYSPPQGRTWNNPPALARDGTAMGSVYFNPSSGVLETRVVIRPDGITVYADSARVNDISDGGAYTVDYATRYDAAGTPQVLIPNAPPAAPTIIPSRISGDGSVVAGSRRDVADWPNVAWRWTEANGLQYLGYARPNAYFNNVHGVSRDGSTIVGSVQVVPGGTTEAWKWTEGVGYTILSPAPGGRPASTTIAYASNDDGSIIVGLDSAPVFGLRAVVWTNGVPQVLPTPAGYRSSEARDMSNDGTIILGRLSSSQVGLPETDAIWTATGGWVPALDYIRQQGIDVPSYYTGFGSFQISADGRTFATRLVDTRNGDAPIAVFVIPSPSGLALLGVFAASTRRSRRCAAHHGSGC